MTYSKIEQFQYWVQQTIPNTFDDSLSFYEVLSKMVNQINTIGEVTNEMTTDLENFFGGEMAVIITDKMNEWLADGTLNDVINEAIFNDLNSQITANKTAIDNINNSIFYHNISMTKVFDTTASTNYTIVRIPLNDEKGVQIPIKQGFANDTPNGGNGEIARKFADRHKTTLTLNTGIFDVDTLKLTGVHINNGVVVAENVTTGTPKYTLAWKDDRTFKIYGPNTSSTAILSEGYTNCVTAFIPMIQNGVMVSQSILDGYSASGTPYERQVIAQTPNKDLIILSCGGEGLRGEPGLTVYDCIRILLTYGVSWAFLLDGGGSTQTVLRGTNIVPEKDDNGLTERLVPSFMYFGKEPVGLSDLYLDIKNAYTDIGVVNDQVQDNATSIYNKTDMNMGYMALKGATGYTTPGIETWEGTTKRTKLSMFQDEIFYYDYVSGKTLFRFGLDGVHKFLGRQFGEFYNANTQTITDCNLMINSGQYWVTPSGTNSPDTSKSWAVTVSNFGTGNVIQEAQSFETPSIRKVRRQSSGTWQAWG